MDGLTVILADMIRSALAWEQVHGLSQHDSEFRPEKALTKIPVVFTVNTEQDLPKGGNNEHNNNRTKQAS